MAFGDSIGGALAGAALADAHNEARDAERERDFARDDLYRLQQRYQNLQQKHSNVLKRFSAARGAQLGEYEEKKQIIKIYAKERGLTEDEIYDVVRNLPEDSPVYQEARAEMEKIKARERAIDADLGIKWEDE